MSAAKRFLAVRSSLAGDHSPHNGERCGSDHSNLKILQQLSVSRSEVIAM